MAAPTERGRTAPTISLSVTSPASTEVGDLVVVITATSRVGSGIPTHTLQGDFTEIGTQTVQDPDPDARISVAFVVATSAGAQSYQAYTASVGTSATGCIVYAVGTFDGDPAPPFAGASSTGNGAPNPPQLTGLTGDFAITCAGMWCYSASTANAATAPTNYTNEVEVAASDILDLSFASRDLTGLSSSTEDPGAFADNTAPACTASITFAIRGAVEITPSGIGTAEAFGTPTIESAVAPAGVASEETFGTTTLQTFLDASGIASLEAFGTADVVLVAAPAGVGTLEAFGTPTIELAGGGQFIDPAGIASLEAFGSANVVEVVAPTGIASLEVFGTAVVVEWLDASGIASLEAFGSANVVEVVAPTGIASLEAFGSANVVEVVAPAGIASLEAFGIAVLQTFVDATGVASLEAFGAATVGTVTFVDASSIASLEAFGAASLHHAISAAGIASLEAFGSPVVVDFVSAAGIASLEAFGSPVVAPVQYVDATGVASLEAFGAPTVILYLAPAGVASLEAFGVSLVEAIVVAIGAPGVTTTSVEVGGITASAQEFLHVTATSVVVGDPD